MDLGIIGTKRLCEKIHKQYNIQALALSMNSWTEFCGL